MTMQHTNLDLLINPHLPASRFVRTGAEIRELVALQEILEPVWAEHDLGVNLEHIPHSQYVLLPQSLAQKLGLEASGEAREDFAFA
jgi:hypothetical protein